VDVDVIVVVVDDDDGENCEGKDCDWGDCQPSLAAAAVVEVSDEVTFKIDLIVLSEQACVSPRCLCGKFVRDTCLSLWPSLLRRVVRLRNVLST